MSKRFVSNLLLLLTAFIWGTSFVAQKVGVGIGTFTYNGTRTLIGGCTLIPFILMMDAIAKKKPDYKAPSDEEKNSSRKILIMGGIACGICLCIASNLQQFGISYTTVANSGFITSLYMVLVPIFSLALGKKIRPIIWLCVVMAIIGFYLLCMTDGFKLHFGDLLTLICAAFFAIHILVIDHFSPKCNGVKLSCFQFFVSGGISFVLMFIFEEPSISNIISSIIPLLYSGVLSCGVAYTLQIVAQKNAEPTQATLLMSLESVFSALSGAILLSERLAARSYLGCAIIFVAVVMAQIPIGNIIKRKSNTLQ